MADKHQAKPRWGIVGLGAIAHDFASALIGNGSTIMAVAARDEGRAAEFASSVGAKKSHGSYEALLHDPEVDVVYISTPHSQHLSNIKEALEAGKHVLSEKPMTANEAQQRELYEIARSKHLFLLEGMWTRFFPAIRKAREVLASGDIGEPKFVQADVGIAAKKDDRGNRIWDPAQAGGVMLDVGVYVVQVATMVFGATMPQQIACTGQKFETGVDEEGAVSLTWEGKGSASLYCTFVAETPHCTAITCAKGSIKVHHPAHAPTMVTVSKDLGSGQTVEETFTFELPKCPPECQFSFKNGEGFIYEVQAVEKALQEGRTECQEYTSEESLVIMRIMDEYRRQIGVAYPFEK